MVPASQDEKVQTLVQLGLTYRQAKVYLAVANLGKARVRTISKFSEVPRQHIYQVMSKLQGLGLVHRVITAPITFKAIPLREGLFFLMSNRVHEVADLQVKTRKLLQDLMEKNNAETTQQEETPQFVLVPGKKATKRQVMQSIENAKTTIDVVCTWHRYLEAVYTYVAVHKKAMERGVRIRQVTELPKDKESVAHARKIEQIFKKYPSNKVRYFPTSITTVVALSDQKEMFVASSPTKKIDGSPGLWSNNTCLIEMAQNYFDIMWRTALREIPEEH